MENYRKSSYYTYDIKYHLVWITKYRKPVLMGKIAIRTRELICKIYQTNDVEILAGQNNELDKRGCEKSPLTKKNIFRFYPGNVLFLLV